jgi:hypothetical protein
MSNAILADRSAQLVMAAEGLGYDEARLRLERAALLIECEPDLDAPHQAVLWAAAACAVRMFKGGVFMSPAVGGRLTIGQTRRRPVRRALEELGVKSVSAPSHAMCLFVGRNPETHPDLFASCDGWSAQIGPHKAPPAANEANVLSGAGAGALAIAELFRKTVLDDVRAAKRAISVDLWGDGHGPARLGALPKEIWLLGLGNLGQAALFVLDLLPWRDPSDVTLLLNDGDVVGPENLVVQILTQHAWIGAKKARACAAWAEPRGFRTIVEERRFTADTRPGDGEPRLALVGVDNLDARRFAAKAGFDLVIDAGLGATGSEAFDIRIHAFPGNQTPDEVWPDLGPDAGARAPSAALNELVEQGRLDPCGAMTIAGASVGVPCTALFAAALQVAQACRGLETGACADRIDLSLSDPRRARWRDVPAEIGCLPLSVQALTDD